MPEGTWSPKFVFKLHFAWVNWKCFLWFDDGCCLNAFPLFTWLTAVLFGLLMSLARRTLRMINILLFARQHRAAQRPCHQTIHHWPTMAAKFCINIYKIQKGILPGAAAWQANLLAKVLFEHFISHIYAGCQPSGQVSCQLNLSECSPLLRPRPQLAAHFNDAIEVSGVSRKVSTVFTLPATWVMTNFVSHCSSARWTLH